ncbi:MAG: hypothetical protein IJ390_05435 [Lachnospiraceae bacterium]|nr:hypothetical protein [Lachnospiraceae bacterium]
MKKKVLALVLSAAMAMSLAACGNSAATTPETTPATEAASTEAATEEVATETATEEVAETPVEGGSLIYGSSTELSGDWGREMWTNNAADKLVRELMDDYGTVVSNQGGEYVVNPTIVKEMDSVVNEDGTKTFTITINEGLVYNNGEAITAKDYVVQTLFGCTQTAQDWGATYASSYLSVVGGQEYKDGTAAAVSGLRLIDDYTFSVQILADKIPYYYDITYAAATPMNLNYWFGEGIDVADDGEGCYFVGDINTDEVKANVEAALWATSDRVTAGPYNLEEFDKSSLQATLVRNPNYAGNFEGQKPYIEKLIIVKAETETWNDAMKTGAMEFYDTIADGSEINAALDLVDTGDFDYVQFDRAGYGKLQFQCDFGPTQFESVRHAVAYLLDRNEFANQFCQGWGSTVDGPYGTGLWQYKEAEEWLADNLNTYAYSVDSAVEALEADGWTLDAEGNEWAGEGLRYKEVTEEEAGTYEGNVTLADGRILMPLSINWASSEGNPVSDLLSVMLAESEEVKSVGMEIIKSEMTFSELLNYMYRDASQGEQYGVPTYGMYNLATGFVPAYDYAYNWTSDPELVAQGYNVNYLFSEELDNLSMDMVYGVESGDTEGYMEIWKEYIKQWNEELPEVPLYSNIYISLIPKKLHGYTQDSFWDFQSAILYAWVEE